MVVGSAADWSAAGVSRKKLHALVASGQLVRTRRGAYATREILAEAAGDPCLAHALQVAAVNATSSRKGVASHHSAARMRGLDMLSPPPAGTVTLTVPPGSRTGRHGTADVLRHAAILPDEHVTRLFGLKVTTVARTVTDIARTSPFMEGVVVTDSALYNRYTSKAEIRRALASCERWPGCELARRVVDFASMLAESVLESAARVFFHEHEVPEPDLQVHILGRNSTVVARADFCWRQYWTIAEADGMSKYQTHDDLSKQYKRDRLLEDAGWEVVHFSWQELFSDPAAVVARIRAAFARALRRQR